MEHANFDINSIHFNDPELIENTNSYMCTATNSKDSNPISVVFNSQFTCRHNEQNTWISTNNKDVVQFINKLYLKIIDFIFEKSKVWFENETTMHEIKQSVIHPVTPNIENNSLEIMCTRGENVNIELNELEKCLVTLMGIEFKDDKFSVILKLENMDDTSESTEKEDVKETSNDEDSELKNVTDENNTTDNTNNALNQTDTVEEESNEAESSEKDTNKEDAVVTDKNELLDDVEEVDISIDDNEDNEEMKMNLEKDNLFMIYDILNEKLRSNIYNSINELFEKKRIDLGDFELEDIIFEDSDDEDIDSDDDEELYE